MKAYEGRRNRNGDAEVVITNGSGGTVGLLNPRHDLRNHSPTGFEWGYGGSGPAQLALAICADVLGDDERARSVYQDFKWRFVARVGRNEEFFVTEERAKEIISDIEAENNHA